MTTDEETVESEADQSPIYAELKEEFGFDPLDRNDESYEHFNLASQYHAEAMARMREVLSTE